MKRNIIGRDRTNKVTFLVLNILFIVAFASITILLLATSRLETTLGLFLLIPLIPFLHYWIYKYIHRPDYVDFAQKVVYLINLFLLFLSTAAMIPAYYGVHPDYFCYSLLLCCLSLQNQIFKRPKEQPRQSDDEVERSDSNRKERK